MSPEAIEAAVLGFVFGPTAVDDLVRSLSEVGCDGVLVKRAVWRLVARGELRVDREKAMR